MVEAPNHMLRLRKAADEMRRENQNGWPLTCDAAADEIESLQSQIAELQDHCNAMEVEHRQAIEEMQSALADNARLRALPLKDEVERVLEEGRKNTVAVMKALMATGSRDNLLLADAVHRADDAARALLSRLRAGEHVEIDPNELAFADLRASGGVFPEFYGPSSASDAELAQAHDDMDTHGVPRQERGHTMSLAARVYWLAKQRIDALRAGEQEGWRPIETAPKDGTPILAFREPSCIGTSSPLVFVAWCEESQEWIWPDDTYDPYVLDSYTEAYQAGSEYADTKFTYWMPLPAAPSDQGGDRG